MDDISIEIMCPTNDTYHLPVVLTELWAIYEPFW